MGIGIIIVILVLSLLYLSYTMGKFTGYMQGKIAAATILTLLRNELTIEQKLLFDEALRSAASNYNNKTPDN